MFHWKKMIAVLCACVLVTACAGAFAEDYTASAPGMGGDVSVTVSYEDGRITAVTVGENNETPGIGDQAINAIPGRIVEEQSLTVDTVAGATVTSNAILTAAEAALTAGGVDVTPFKQEKQPTELVEGEAVETDIVIVGAGISGLMAAYELKEGLSGRQLHRPGEAGHGQRLAAGLRRRDRRHQLEISCARRCGVHHEGF